MITKVRQLTRMNIHALLVTSAAKALGATYAEFEGTPSQALAKVDQIMAECPTGIRRSLQAVRRKLVAAVPRYDAADEAARVSLTPYVDVLH
jgi:hypothetical protein